MDDSYSVEQDVNLYVMPDGVLANDTDPDMDMLSAVLEQPPANGSLTFNSDGSFDYTPNSGFLGFDSFTYHPFDGLLDGNTSTVTIDVTSSGGGGGGGGGGNSAPAAGDDAWTTQWDTLSVVAPGVLHNDSDADGDSLMVSLSSGAQHGTVSLNSNGSFDYTPNAGYVGTDSFTYTASDGTDSSDPATVTLTVIDTFGARMNQDDLPLRQLSSAGGVGIDRQTGEAGLGFAIGGGQALSYRSLTSGQAVVAVDVPLDSQATVPSQIETRLTVGGQSGPTIFYDGSSLMPGDSARFATQFDGGTLGTGQYDWQLDVISRSGSDEATQSYSGNVGIVNRDDSVFGANWNVSGLSQLVEQSDGVLLVAGSGATAWFADSSGTFVSPPGPLQTSSLVQNADNSFTLTSKYGTHSEFDSDGLLTSRVDNNGNTVSFTYVDADLDGATDDLSVITSAFGRTLSLSHDANGYLDSVTDPAGQVTSVSIDGSGNLSSFTAPDPDGTGPLAAAVTSFSYDTSDRLTTISETLSRTTQLQYNFAGQLTQVTDPLANNWQFNPVQTDGLIDTSSGTGTSANLASLSQYGGMSATSSDPLGNQDTFEIDRFGNVIQHTNALGFIVTYDRDADGRVTQVTQPDPDDSGPLAASVTTYSYDSSGNVTQVTFADGSTDSSVYDPTLNRPTQVTDPLGRITTLAYDTAGNLLSTTDPAGNVTSLAYDANGLVTSTTLPDPDGAGPLVAPVLSIAYDVLGQPVTTTNPDGTTRQFVYDVAGNLVSVTDELGRVTTSTFDNLNRLLTVTAPDPDGVGPLAVPVISFNYDIAGRMISQTDPDGNVTTSSYDALGRVLSVTLPDPDGAGPLASPITSVTYDAAGRRDSATNALGDTTTFQYNAANWLMNSITYPDPDGIGSLLAPIIFFQYDNLGRRTKITDPLGNDTTYAFDSLNRVTSVTDALDGVSSVAFDAAGNRTSVTDPLGNVTSFAYDNLDRLLSVTQPDPDDAGPLTAAVTSYGYDNLGRTTTLTDPLGSVTSYGYDINSRRTSLTDPTGNSTNVAYDAVGNRTTVTDALGNVRSTAYDNLNRATSSTDAAGGVTSFAYSILSQLTALTDPVGNTTTFTRDNLSRLTSETNELAQTRTYAWDAASNLTSRTDRTGRIIEFDYDTLSRRTQERWVDTDGTTIVHTIDMIYDSASQLTDINDSDSSYTFSYDALGRLSSVDNTGTPDAPNVVLTYGYDAGSRRTSASATIDGTADFSNTYQFDNLGRVTQLERSSQAGGNTVGDKRVDLTYTDRGQFASISRYEDLFAMQEVATTTYAYDADGRLTALDHDQGATSLAAYTWTYTSGRLTQATSVDGTTDYTYDATGQLTAADHSSQTNEAYSYDANGNRTNTGYSTGTNNQLLSDGTFNYEYDDEGNRTKKTTIATSDYVEYSWDHRNRLSRIEFNASGGATTKVVAYTYDALNRRIAKQVDDDGDGDFDRATQFVYDSSNKPDSATNVPLDDIVLVFEDADGDGPGATSRDSRLLHGPSIDQVFATESTSGDILWALADHQGTVRDWVDHDSMMATTTIVNHLKYDSFGNITAIEDDAGTATTLAVGLSTLHYAYTGRIWDSDVGLYDYRARLYDAATGRFISEDPIGFRGDDLNLSRYVANGVTSFIDPSGNSAIQRQFQQSTLNAWLSVFGPGATEASALAAVEASGTDLARAPSTGGYFHYLTNPSQMDTDLRYTFYGAVGVAAVAGTAAGGGWVVARAFSPGQLTSVFFSGTGASAQATAVATQVGGSTTVGMTLGGRILTVVARPLPQMLTRPVWSMASRIFANGTTGTAMVVQPFAGSVSTTSIWATVELPILMQNAVRITTVLF